MDLPSLSTQCESKRKRKRRPTTTLPIGRNSASSTQPMLATSTSASDADRPPSPVLCPVSMLLDSHYFFGSGLSIVNHEAASHTRTLAKSATVLTRFLRRCAAVGSMHYDDVAATFSGPTIIPEDTTDVLMVTILRNGFQYCHNALPDVSVANLGQAIQDWFECRVKFESYDLPSGSIVDVSLSTNDACGCIFVRGAVLRRYLKYNSLWSSVATPLNNLDDVHWWIVTTDEWDNYSKPENDEVYLEVFRSLESYKDNMDY